MNRPGLGLKKLTGNIAATLARQLGAGVLQLLTLALIARVFGPQGNGAYAVALLLPTTLASLLNLGIGSANIYYLGAARVGAAAALRTTFKLHAVIALLGLAVEPRWEIRRTVVPGRTRSVMGRVGGILDLPFMALISAFFRVFSSSNDLI